MTSHSWWVPTHLDRVLVKNEVLCAYLNTHRSVGVAVIRRVTWVLGRAEGPVVPLLEHFRADVEAEQLWVVDLMKTMRLSSTVAMKSSVLTAHAVHQLMRIRRQTVDFGRLPLIDVETFSGSVTAKFGLWQTLGDLWDVLPVDRARLEVFEVNAQRQLADLTAVHQCVSQDAMVA